jgi:hypothetical protein
MASDKRNTGSRREPTEGGTLLDPKPNQFRGRPVRPAANNPKASLGVGSKRALGWLSDEIDQNSAISDSPHHASNQSLQGVCETIFDDDDNRNGQSHMTSVGVKDELVSTLFDAVRCLPADKQAAILLDTSLVLIEAGQCGVSRLFFLNINSLSCADMEPKSKIFSKSTSRPRVCRKRM